VIHGVRAHDAHHAVRILMMTSNGVGLGHLTRVMAIAHHLPAFILPVLFTLSQAFGVARRAGFVVEYLPSATQTHLPPDRWHRLLETRVGELVEEYAPAVVLYDGAQVPKGLRDAMAATRDPTWVWCRRGMWKRDAEDHHLRAAPLFDHALAPGELAAEDDTGITALGGDGVRDVPPIRLLDDRELLEPARSVEELRLPPASVRILVQLGAVNPATAQAIAAHCAALVDAGDGTQVVVADSPIARDDVELPDQLLRRSVYPVSRHLRAFDIAIAASGYNTFHELLHFGVPTVFVPNVETALDDQLARARYADRIGAARACHPDELDELPRHIEKLLDPAAREAMRRRCQGCRFPNGAVDAARFLEQLAADRNA
jgi:hypothetical protein